MLFLTYVKNSKTKSYDYKNLLSYPIQKIKHILRQNN